MDRERDSSCHVMKDCSTDEWLQQWTARCIKHPETLVPKSKIQEWNIFVISWHSTYTGSDMMFLPPQHHMLGM